MGIVFSHNKSIHFQTTSFAEVKALAKKENKPIFIIVCTQWCAACKKMKKTLYKDKAVADFCNSKFINYELDATNGVDKEFENTGEISCFPNLLFMDAEGKIIHRTCGAPQNAEEMIKLLNDVFIPEKTFGYYYYQYDKKIKEASFLFGYLPILKKINMPYEQLITDYFKAQTDEQLTKRGNWEAIKSYCTDFKSREFIYVVNNQDKYKKLYTPDSVNTAMVNLINQIIICKLVQSNKRINDSDLEFFKGLLHTLDEDVQEEAMFMTDVFYLHKSNQRKEMFELIKERGDKYFEKIPNEEIVDAVTNYCEDTVCLKLAANHYKIKMSKYIPDSKDEQKKRFMTDINENYTTVLKKLNRKNEAKKSAGASVFR
ncbi:MAG: thioredoxin family protein [Bacteroidota bacterium]